MRHDLIFCCRMKWGGQRWAIFWLPQPNTTSWLFGIFILCTIAQNMYKFIFRRDCHLELIYMRIDVLSHAWLLQRFAFAHMCCLRSGIARVSIISLALRIHIVTRLVRITFLWPWIYICVCRLWTCIPSVWCINTHCPLIRTLIVVCEHMHKCRLPMYIYVYNISINHNIHAHVHTCMLITYIHNICSHHTCEYMFLPITSLSP
jgi:hypothetical protein